MKPTRRPAILASCAAVLALSALLPWLLGRGGAPLANPAEPVAPAVGLTAASGDLGSRTAREPAARASGYYTAPVGTALRYDLGGRFEYAVVHPEAGRQASGFAVHGALEVVVADRRDDEILLRVALPGLGLSALPGMAGADEAGLAVAAREPFHVRLGVDGAVRGYRFERELTTEQRNFVRGLFSAYAHTVAADAPDAWQADDVDAAGVFTARYTRSEPAADVVCVERTKLHYTESAGGQVRPHTLSGGSKATLSRELGWLVAVEVDERHVTAVPEIGAEVDLRSVLGLELRDRASGAVAADEALWSEGWLPAAGHREDFAAAADASENARWQKRLAGHTLASLSAELAELLAAVPQDPEAIDAKWVEIGWLVQLDPAVARQIRDCVAAGVEQRLGDMLVTALGAAGTEQAQQALAELRADAALSPETRRSATIAMLQIAEPTSRVLGDLAGDLDRSTDFAGDDALAMLMLGALAPRAGEARIAGRVPFDVLLGFEERAREQGRLDLWLNALGNAATADIVPHAERLTSHDDEAVRAAAYHALRRVADPSAVALLERGLGDASSVVRTDVVKALGEHRSEAACAVLMRALQSDADPEVRRMALGELARMATPESQALRAIEQCARRDADEQNRRAARELLAGMR